MKRFILTDYIEHAMAHAVYDKFKDGTFSGSIPLCKGVVACAPSLHECEHELRAVLEAWILVDLKLGHPLPVIDKIDLNKIYVEDRKRHNLLHLEGKIQFAEGYKH